MTFSLRCPVCRQKFPWVPTQGFPDECPNKACKTHIGIDRADDDIVMPFVRSGSRSKSIDNVYRDMERGSEVRAQMAADMVGVPVAEMSDLKITNLKDRQKPGDICAPIVSNDISRMMDANPNLATMGLELSRNVMVGPQPNAGAKTRTMVQNMHQDMVRQHCVGVDAYTRQPVAPSTDVVSERPANEVMQPGYRRRG